jgi:hypothetical protein
MGRRGTRTAGRAAALPALRRHWPWVVAAVIAGAVAGGAGAYVLRRVQAGEPEGAVDPAAVHAVVDRPEPRGTDAVPAAPPPPSAG